MVFIIIYGIIKYFYVPVSITGNFIIRYSKIHYDQTTSIHQNEKSPRTAPPMILVERPGYKKSTAEFHIENNMRVPGQ